MQVFCYGLYLKCSLTPDLMVDKAAMLEVGLDFWGGVPGGVARDSVSGAVCYSFSLSLLLP